jgi:hydroxyacylglutathione hydrolase
MRSINQAGPRLTRDISMPPQLDPKSFATMIPGGIVVDVRNKEAYARGHIPGSLSNPLRDDFSVWLGWLVPADVRLLFVTHQEPLAQVVDASLLVGYEDFGGWLAGGIEAWQAAGQPLRQIDLVGADEAHKQIIAGAVPLDVREPDEYTGGHIQGAIHVPLGKLARQMELVPRDRPVVVYCGHGERASTGASLLEKAGFEDLINLDGGIGAWRDNGYPVEPGA